MERVGGESAAQALNCSTAQLLNGSTAMTKCYKCGAEISSDEIGLNYKLINRGVDKFLCFDCLGKVFDLSLEKLQELIEHFRKSGCSMFK